MIVSDQYAHVRGVVVGRYGPEVPVLTILTPNLWSAVGFNMDKPTVTCHCGQRTIPENVDRVYWYWQAHGRKICTLELPNERCWCGLLRHEHIEGHKR